MPLEGPLVVGAPVIVGASVTVGCGLDDGAAAGALVTGGNVSLVGESVPLTIAAPLLGAPVRVGAAVTVGCGLVVRVG